jgi:hypothetical protein
MYWGYQLHGQQNDAERTRGAALQEVLLREANTNIAELTLWKYPRKWAMIQPWMYCSGRRGADGSYRCAKIVWGQRSCCSLLEVSMKGFIV